MFSRRTSACLLACTVGLIPACAEEGEDGLTEFRPYVSPPGPFWEWGIGSVDANGSLQIYAGASNTSIGCLSYTIGGDLPTAVQQVQPDGSFGPGPLVVDNIIYDATERPVCIATQDDENPALFRLANPDTTIFTLWGRFLFDGHIAQVPPTGTPAFQSLLAEDLVYSFAGNQVFEGGDWQGNVLASMTVDDVAMANPMRKLLFGALVEAHCGSNGLVEEEEWPGYYVPEG